MLAAFSSFLDRLSEFLAHRKGLLPFLGIGLVAINFIFQFLPLGWWATSNFFLHLGVILAIVGFMIAWAL